MSITPNPQKPPYATKTYAISHEFKPIENLSTPSLNKLRTFLDPHGFLHMAIYLFDYKVYHHLSSINHFFYPTQGSIINMRKFKTHRLT
jgi:hypothetical protein